MTDETTETTADTTTAVTPAESSGVLDLRPPQESVRAELCRLGLEFSSTDGTAPKLRDKPPCVPAPIDDSRTSLTISDGYTHISPTRFRHVRHVDGREDESRPHPHLGRA